MFSPSLDSLASRSSDLAMRSAVDRLASLGRLEALRGDLEAQNRLVALIRAEVSPAVSQALSESREALEAHMPEAAEALWVLNFRQAGIRAADRFLES